MAETAHIPLRLVAAGRPGALCEGVFVPPSPRLDDFVAVAAERGLHAPEAVRLGLERHFALIDTRRFGLDVDTCRRLLCERASATAPRRSLSGGEAARARRLAMSRPVAPAATGDGLRVAIPGRLLTRFGERVPGRAFRAAHVAEMVQWELAATLEGRTIGEWALLTVGNVLAA